MTRLGIVGPGRAGTLLATAASRAGWRVVGIAGGSDESAASLQALVAGVRRCETPVQLADMADTLVLAVPDDRIAGVAGELAVSDRLGESHRVVHLSGAHGLDVLRRVALTGARIAACHPAITIPSGATDPDLLVGAAWGVSCASIDRDWVGRLVTDLGGDVVEVPDARRPLYHAALTVGSNGVGAAVATARQLLLAARIDHPDRLLGPLIEASVANVLSEGAASLTGPVVRGDVGSVAAHLDAIGGGRLADAYRLLQHAVLCQVEVGLDASRAAELAGLLESRGGDRRERSDGGGS